MSQGPGEHGGKSTPFLQAPDNVGMSWWNASPEILCDRINLGHILQYTLAF